MDWLARIDLVNVANALVILIVGLAAGLGWRNKTAARDEPKAQLEIQAQGAIVDSSSLRSATIEIANLAEATADSAKEMGELRHTVNRLREAIDRHSLETARRR